MPKAQRLLIVAVLYLLCGLFCVPDIHAQDSSAEGGQGFDISGGVGPAVANGTVGTSPEVQLASVGITRTPGYYGRACYPLPALYEGLDLRVTAEYMGFRFSGNAVYSANEPWTSGTRPPFYGILPGDRVDAKLNIDLTMVSTDVLYDTFSFAYLGRLKLGPRFEYFSYKDTFTINNLGGSGLTLAREYEQARNYSLLGLGIAGALEWDAFAPAGLVTFRPAIRFAATSVFSRGMRISQYEAFLELLVRSASGSNIASTGFPLAMPGLSFQAGYSFTNITETRDDINVAGFGGPAATLRTDAARYNVGFPIVRATLAF